MYFPVQYLSISVAVILFITGCNDHINSDDTSSSTFKTQATGKVGGNCDTCELMYINMPSKISASDTSEAWNSSNGQKLIVSGTVYKTDKKTPAKGIIIYYWQTNEKGFYANHPTLDSRAARHGYIRGWVKTDSEGKYTIYTIRPASYPHTNLPAHIHLLVKEPNLKNEYYIDDIIFTDDPLVTEQVKKDALNKGGSGIAKANNVSGVLKATRNIILGQNIQNYPY
jgi:protocatechuate 3,4-dioxygenase beta subunit